MKTTTEEFRHTFRCGTSDKLLHLAAQELKQIPYLAALVEHDDHLAPSENRNGEYVLNPSIPYSWLSAIHRSITSEQPSSLFSQLSPGKDALGMVRLYDSLGITPIPDPFLKDIDLVRSDQTQSDQSNQFVNYHPANLMEARNTSAEFLIALAKKKYDLHDSRTRECIFSLVKIILSSPCVFDRRFRHHTLTIVNKLYTSSFPAYQRNQLLRFQQSLRDDEGNVNPSTNDANKRLPFYFQNSFSWRGIHQPTEPNESGEESPSLLSLSSQLGDFSPRISYVMDTISLDSILPTMTCKIDYRPILVFDSSGTGKSQTLKFSCKRWIKKKRNPDVVVTQRAFIESWLGEVSDLSSKKLDPRRAEAQAARSGQFNTLPRRPTVDKFKHRFGPKTKSHR